MDDRWPIMIRCEWKEITIEFWWWKKRDPINCDRRIVWSLSILSDQCEGARPKTTVLCPLIKFDRLSKSITGTICCSYVSRETHTWKWLILSGSDQAYELVKTATTANRLWFCMRECMRNLKGYPYCDWYHAKVPAINRLVPCSEIHRPIVHNRNSVHFDDWKSRPDRRMWFSSFISHRFVVFLSGSVVLLPNPHYIKTIMINLFACDRRSV